MRSQTGLIIALSFIFFTFSYEVFSQSASRTVNGSVLYYNTLNDAFAAAAGASIEAPDEIAVLDDITLVEPILIDTTKHIRLAAEGGGRIIRRAGTLLEDPLFRVTGENASLALGKPGMEYELFIDGGRFENPPIQAKAPLVVVNGLDAKVIMYDNVFIQNNHNVSDALDINIYQLGAGVFMRCEENRQDRQPEFIMKGGTIRGNVNNTQYVPCGGGVYIAGFALFTMEGGVISGNTAYQTGGGFHTGSRGSFKKTGGIIYGLDTSEELNNRVINGLGKPPIYGFALMIPAVVPNPIWRGRDTTVEEQERLTYTGAQVGQDVSFGENEHWIPMPYYPEELPSLNSKYIFIAVASGAVFAAAIVIIILLVFFKRRAALTELPPGFKARTLEPQDIPADISPREKEIFTLLLTEVSRKQIADILKVSVHTIDFHSANLYRKLGIQSRAELFTKYGKPRENA
jgi:DNA-binding CsgD family transcriptional regulator